MVARGFVEGRRSAMPDVNLSDKEIAAEDRAARAKSARACELHLADLIRYHSAGRKSASGRNFVILSRGCAEEALTWTKAVMTKLGLALNEAKTSVKNAREESFDFLGYTLGPRH
jgi:hypothetical protein